MKEHSTKTEPPQFLGGWKEIASYLGKGVRTVQRYERYLGLPVRRPAGRPWGSVIATKAELDAWVKASPIRDIYQLRDPQTEHNVQARALEKGVTEMRQLRQQMLALRQEVRRSVDLLHNNICELQDTLNPQVQDSFLYSRNERDSLSRSILELKAAVKYPKAS
jgi:hypothetical protein